MLSTWTRDSSVEDVAHDDRLWLSTLASGDTYNNTPRESSMWRLTGDRYVRLTEQVCESSQRQICETDGTVCETDGTVCETDGTVCGDYRTV